MVHSITLLTPETVPAPMHTQQVKPLRPESQTPLRLEHSGPTQDAHITQDSSPSKVPDTDAAVVGDPGHFIMDRRALRSAIQSRGVERLAQDSGRPLFNSRPSPQDRWQKSIEQAALPDCLAPDSQGMGLLNAPVLIFKAITDKCK